MPSSTANCEYKTLDMILEAPDLPMEVNLYAVVTDCTMPRPTKRDWMSNMRIVDPSTLGGEGVEVLFFAAQYALLPRSACVGDIVRLHRMTVQEFHGKAQLVASVGPRRRCSYCLFSSAQGAPVTVHQSSTQGYFMDEHEEGIVNLLRAAIAQGAFCAAAGQLGGALERYLRRIRELDPTNMTSTTEDGTLVKNTFFDICSKVVHVGDTANGRTMFVWDGTDALPMALSADTREDFVEQAEGDSHDIMQLGKVALPPTASDVPRLGTALPVVLYGLDLPHAGQMLLPAAGDWVKLRNVGACIIDGQLQALFRASSKWSLWTPSQESLRALDSREEAGSIAEWAPEDASELLATSPHTNMPFETLRQVQQASVGKRGTQHRCLVRVVNYNAVNAPHFWAPLPGDSGRCAYMFALTLQDATGELDACVFRDAGAQFFWGWQADEICESKGLQEVIARAMRNLLGEQGCSRQGGAWIEVCLRGYTRNAGCADEARMYQVFDTKLTPQLHRLCL